ncbi:MAG: 30S ribosome-binding factor RbfA [Bacteroidales bacterium]|nr:30S ribosome-binding factor RbfA [Bacteroidales bacterium]
MESKRQNKISKLLQKDLGEIFQLQSRNLFGGALITVTKVNVTNDMSIAKVYLSLFATKNKEELLENIRRRTKDVRRELGFRVKNQLRAVPELKFYLDDSLDYIDNIESLLKE